MPWSRKWQPTPVFLPGKFHGQRGAWGSIVHRIPKSSDRTEWLSSQYSREEVRWFHSCWPFQTRPRDFLSWRLIHATVPDYLRAKVIHLVSWITGGSTLVSRRLSVIPKIRKVETFSKKLLMKLNWLKSSLFPMYADLVRFLLGFSKLNCLIFLKLQKISF